MSALSPDFFRWYATAARSREEANSACPRCQGRLGSLPWTDGTATICADCRSSMYASWQRDYQRRQRQHQEETPAP